MLRNTVGTTFSDTRQVSTKCCNACVSLKSRGLPYWIGNSGLSRFLQLSDLKFWLQEGFKVDPELRKSNSRGIMARSFAELSVWWRGSFSWRSGEWSFYLPSQSQSVQGQIQDFLWQSWCTCDWLLVLRRLNVVNSQVWPKTKIKTFMTLLYEFSSSRIHKNWY